MKLKELNTPFEKKRMLAYGRDGNTAVRRYIEVQRITGNLYKSRTEIVGWGYEQCRLYLFFPGCPAGLDLGHLSFFGERTVEDMEQDYTANGLDSPEHFIETTDRQAADGGFIGNTLIEFVKGWSPKKAEEYAAIRQSRLDEPGEQARAGSCKTAGRTKKAGGTDQTGKRRKKSLPARLGGHYAGASVEPGACRAVKAIPLRRYCENKAPACNRLCGRRISA